MKEHLQKQRLQRLCYKREWAQFDRGRRSFSPQSQQNEKKITGANERERVLSTGIQSANMIEIGLLMLVY